jgi:hypothetical protein
MVASLSADTLMIADEAAARGCHGWRGFESATSHVLLEVFFHPPHRARARYGLITDASRFERLNCRSVQSSAPQAAVGVCRRYAGPLKSPRRALSGA